MFSNRTAWPREPNELSRLRAQLEQGGEPILDLASSNPTACGFLHEPEFYRGLADEQSAVYRPHPLGLPTARAAVAGYYAERGRSIDPHHVWLGAGTSELYAQLLSLLCDPRDEILVPRPGYPLLDYLGDVAGVSRVRYDLAYDGQWHLDTDALYRALGSAERPKALLAVSPNNPTGNYLKRHELERIQALCAEHGMALVVDEVFSDYLLGDVKDPALHPTGDEMPCLTFVLSGLSKVAALPQLKLSWGVAGGPERDVAEAMARLEILGDSFLSTATPVQLSLPGLLKCSKVMQTRIMERCLQNLATVVSAVAGSPVTALAVEGGWTVLLRLPSVGSADDEDWAVRLLLEEGIAVQPGHLFDLHQDPPHLALSLLTPCEILRDGCTRIVNAVVSAMR